MRRVSSSSEDGDGVGSPRSRRESHLGFRVDIPEFEGHLDPDLFLAWLRKVERIFDYKEIPEKKKVKLVALKLRKYASTWWDNLVAKRARKGKDKIRSWDQMRNKLKDKFLPPHYLQDHYLKLHPFPSLDVLSSLTHKVEQQGKSKGTSPLSKPYTQPCPSLGNPNTFPCPQSTQNPRPAPPTAQTPPQRTHPKPNEGMRCSRCQGVGHIASECPNKKIVTLAECQASLGELEKEEEEGGQEACLNAPIEEVEEGPDEGDLLVIRKALNGLTSQNELEQRETIFHPRCTLGGKVCSLIIDGGSCANFASLGMVEKLPLQALAHPHPSLISSFQAYNLAAPSKIPHVLFPQRTIIHKVDLPHETNEDLLSLRTNSKQAGEYDGDHPPNDHTIIREGGGDSKEVGKVPYKARNKLKQSNSAHGTSPGI